MVNPTAPETLRIVAFAYLCLDIHWSLLPNYDLLRWVERCSEVLALAFPVDALQNGHVQFPGKPTILHAALPPAEDVGGE